MTGRINAADLDLAASLSCGQAFRWEQDDAGWFTGVIGNQVWRLYQAGDQVDWVCWPDPKREPVRSPDGSAGRTATGNSRNRQLREYLALDRSLPDILATFPADPQLRAAVQAHRGLRVLRQEPWETLASFVSSSAKQIVQIRQIVRELARRFGDPIPTDHGVFHGFPTADRLAGCSQRELRDCKLGFRAKHLLAAAQAVVSGQVRLAELSQMNLDDAVEMLGTIRGVGEKIALCTLLFGCGHDAAFPIDVWVERALRRRYFAGQQVTGRELRRFTREYFGPYAGWAQQYLFHDERVSQPR